MTHVSPHCVQNGYKSEVTEPRPLVNATDCFLWPWTNFPQAATMANDRFGVVDYVVFLLMMLISTLIGIWYGCGPGGRQKTTAEYLLGDRKMSHWPVAISLLVTFLSAVSLIGIPSEVYTYGIQYCVSILFGPILSLLPVSIIFVPMYRRVNITCANEYLERRFSVGVRMVGCALFMLHYTLYLSVAIFAPSLALEAVAGIPLPVSILTTGIVCTFYTSLGGLKAVVWTDVFQSVVMMGGLIAILVIGSVEVGGLDKVWQINKAYNRTTLFDFNPDPKVRNTFWTLTIGGALTIMPTWSVSQTSVQRFLAMKSLKDAKRAVWINVPSLMIYGLVCSLAGLVIFAVYSGCDPRADKKIASNDQALPYFVINKLHHLHGVPGLFTGSLYAGALSTASSALNAMSLVVLEDIIKKTKRNLTDSEAARLCKMIAVVFGVIVIGGAFVVRYLGAMVLQLSLSIAGIVSGPLLGIFLLGMFVRRANVKGAYAGVFCGIAMAFWVFVGSGLYPPNKYPGTRSVRDCQFYKNALFYQSIAGNVSAMNVSFVTQKQVNDSMKILEKYGDGYIHNSYESHGVEIADTLYHISYLWLSGLGIMTSFVMGLVISYMLETKADRQKEIDPKLLFPVKEWLYGFLPGHSFTWDIDDDLTKVDGETKKESVVEDVQEFATSHSEIEDSVVNETTKDEQMTQSCYETKF